MNQDIKSLTVEKIWSNAEALAFIKNQFAPTLDQNEWNLFVSIGRNTGTNPLLREIWAVKYGGKCSIFIGRDGYRKSAQRHPEYDSHSSFAIYSNDKLEFQVDGTPNITPNLKDRGTLIGAIAWCKRKGSQMVNCTGIVNFSEYNTGLSNWKKMPDTMIKKVAEAQVLRQTFQELFSGTYDESESGAIEGTLAESVEPELVEQIKEIKTLTELKIFHEKNKGRGKDFDKLIVARKKEIEQNNIEKVEKTKTDLAQDIENTLGDGKDLGGKGFPPKCCQYCDTPPDGVHDLDCPLYKKPIKQMLDKKPNQKTK